MSVAKAKTIKLLLNDGTLKGVISMADSSWNSGKFYSAPRDNVDSLLNMDICKNYGVYLLLSDEKVYIGQASDLSQRIKQHKLGKQWWDRVVILTTDNDSLDKADIDYLEATLINLADKIGRLDSDNKNKGNKKKVNEFRQVELEQYLEEALFLLELIGINVFCEEKPSKGKKKGIGFETGYSVISQSDREIREKKEAISFLNENGIKLLSNTNYAKRQVKKSEFWINPKTYALDSDWNLILNNQFTNEIVILMIPAHTFSMKSKSGQGFLSRHDKPELIDLNIDEKTFIDKRSKLDLSSYVVKKVKY